MKNAIVLHGTGSISSDFWFPYIQDFLQEKGYNVWVPDLPNTDIPTIEEWLPFVLEKAEFTSETILIGHSAGSQLILSILENIQVKIKQAILVSGYARGLRDSMLSDKEVNLEWDKIKEHAEEIIFVNSDNDPWGCTDAEGRKMVQKLAGTLIIPKGQGHMGSQTYNQPDTEFPLLIKLIKFN
jgi:predicted alpha/beta hydrolase family esterase